MNLPFQLSDAVTLVAVAALWRPRPLLVELVYYWAFAATLQALATPDLRQAYPDVLYFTYFTTHGGALAAACLLVIGERRLPRAGSAIRAYAVTAAFAVAAAIATLATGGNYLFLRRKPVGGSLLDAMGPGRSTSRPRRRSGWRCSWRLKPPPDTMLARMRRGLLALAIALPARPRRLTPPPPSAPRARRAPSARCARSRRRASPSSPTATRSACGSAGGSRTSASPASTPWSSRATRSTRPAPRRLPGLEATAFVERAIKRSRWRVRLAAQKLSSRAERRRAGPSGRAGRPLARPREARAAGRARAVAAQPHRERAQPRVRRPRPARAAAGKALYDPDGCGAGPDQDLPISVTVNWDADGDDAGNFDGEWVDVHNGGGRDLRLGGWWVRDSFLRFGQDRMPGHRLPGPRSSRPADAAPAGSAAARRAPSSSTGA